MRRNTEGRQNLSASGMSGSEQREESKYHQLWKLNDEKAQKNGSHRTIYWVKHSKKYEDGSLKGEKWITSSKYIGDWEKNKKHGFGIQYYGNGDKYEGTWESNMRNGQGTLWVLDEKKKLRREYTGDWVNDKRTGRGTMFFKNDDRYDGYWLEDMPHGEGRMIYANGDIYEGMWSFGKKAGYGKLTRRNGDHFEGHWVNDKREGKGSYFYSSKNKVFVGEWVDDMPKAGVYSEVDDPDNPKLVKPLEFTDPYVLPDLPSIKLDNPAEVLEVAVEDAKQARIFYRAAFIPRNELFSTEELNELEKEFKAAEATGVKETINITNLKAILQNLNFDQTEEEIKEMLLNIDEGSNPDEITFDLFCKLVAIYIELANSPAIPKSDDIKEESARKYEQDDLGEDSQYYD